MRLENILKTIKKSFILPSIFFCSPLFSQDIQHDIPHIADSIINSAWNYYDANLLDSSFVNFEKAYNFSSENNNLNGQIRSLLGLSEIHVRKGEFLLASDKQRILLEKSLLQGDSLRIADANLNLGFSLYKLDSIEDALKNTMFALNMYEHLQDKKGMHQAYTNLAMFMANFAPDKARDYIRQDSTLVSDLIENSSGSERDYFQSKFILAVENIGYTFHSEGLLDIAKKYYVSADSLAKTWNREFNLTSIYNKLGSLSQSSGDKEEALNYYQQACDIAKKYNDDVGLAFTLLNWASLDLLNKNTSEASKKLTSAKDLFGNSDDSFFEREYANNNYQLFEQKGDYKNALFYYQKFNDLKFENLSKKNSALVGFIEAEYQTKKKEEENIRLKRDFETKNRELKQKNKLFLTASGAALSVSALLMLTGAMYRKKKRLSNMLSEKNKEMHALNNILELQNSELEQANKEIDQSLKYASYQQRAMAPSSEQLDSLLGPHFLFQKPKQIVSGDFLFARNHSDFVYFGVCDGTGHGVGGAFTAILSSSFLHNSLMKKNCSLPSEMLTYARDELINNSSSSVVDSGFDGVIFRYNKKNNELIYSSANNPFFIHRDGSLIIHGKNHVSVSPCDTKGVFVDYKINIMPGDMLYTFSDGYKDQFGGPYNKTFSTKQFKDLLTNIGTSSLEDQLAKLESSFSSWKKDGEQTDDITVLGVRF